MLNGEHWTKRSFDNNSVLLFILHVRSIDRTNHYLLTYGRIEHVESLEKNANEIFQQLFFRERIIRGDLFR